MKPSQIFTVVLYIYSSRNRFKASFFVFDFAFHLQSKDQAPPEQAGESELPSPQSALYTPPVEETQVTDIFYEDTVNNFPLESSASAATESSAAAAAVPGQTLQEEIYSGFFCQSSLHKNILDRCCCSSWSSAGGEFKLMNV